MDGHENPPRPATTHDGDASTQPAAPRTDAPGSVPDKVGRYHVADRLGQGGMGDVLLAHDPVLSRHIALKRIRKDRRETRDVVRRFQIEAHVTARLQHPSIVPVYQYVEDGADSFYGYGWVVMDTDRGNIIRHNGGNPYFSNDFLRYVETWSGLRRAIDSGERGLRDEFAARLRDVWPDPGSLRRVRWPLVLRIGRI